MDRRGFIGRLMAGLAGVAIAPSELLWRPTSADLALPSLRSGVPVTLQAILNEMVMLLEHEMGGRTMVVPGHDYRIGDHAQGRHHAPILLDRQFSVTTIPPLEVDRYGLDIDRYLAPAAQALARKAKQDRLSVFGELPLLRSVERVAIAAGESVCIRGMMAFDMSSGQNVLRFDLLGGV